MCIFILKDNFSTERDCNKYLLCTWYIANEEGGNEKKMMYCECLAEIYVMNITLRIEFSDARTLLLNSTPTSYTSSSSSTIPQDSSCSTESNGTLDTHICRSHIKLWISWGRRTSNVILRVSRLFRMMPGLKKKQIVQAISGKFSSRRKWDKLKFYMEISLLVRELQGRLAKNKMWQDCQQGKDLTSMGTGLRALEQGEPSRARAEVISSG